MKTILLIFIFLGVLLADFSAWADSFTAIRSEYHTLSPQERIARLEFVLESAAQSDKRVIELLITDAKYENGKRQIATQMFSLARNRIQSMPSDAASVFIREAAQYDALSIIQSIPFGWLSTADQEQAVELVKQIEAGLRSPEESRLSPDPPSSDNTASASGSIDDAIAIINIALGRAKKEDLSIIAEARPNGVLNKALQECESARDLLIVHSPELTGSARSRWEVAMVHLSKAVTILKERQRLKYALWAEGRYRETDSPNVTGKLGEARVMELYKRLSEVNVSLLAEPSLSREITKRLYELYDSIDSLKSKERVRYDTIISLEKRKTLDDF